MSLSLVLPCYNVMKYLPKCLDSIFKNDCNDIEIILVNDGSSDDIGGGLSQYFNKDNCDHNIEFEYKDARIKIIHTCNSGVSAARNTGIENATSDYIVFIDPDDTIKETINEQISNFAQTYPTNLKASSNEALLFMRRYRFANCSCFSCCFKDAYPSSNVQ